MVLTLVAARYAACVILYVHDDYRGTPDAQYPATMTLGMVGWFLACAGALYAVWPVVRAWLGSERRDKSWRFSCLTFPWPDVGVYALLCVFLIFAFDAKWSCEGFDASSEMVAAFAAFAGAVTVVVVFFTLLDLDDPSRWRERVVGVYGSVARLRALAGSAALCALSLYIYFGLMLAHDVSKSCSWDRLEANSVILVGTTLGNGLAVRWIFFFLKMSLRHLDVSGALCCCLRRRRKSKRAPPLADADGVSDGGDASGEDSGTEGGVATATANRRRSPWGAKAAACITLPVVAPSRALDRCFPNLMWLVTVVAIASLVPSAVLYGRLYVHVTQQPFNATAVADGTESLVVLDPPGSHWQMERVACMAVGSLCMLYLSAVIAGPASVPPPASAAAPTTRDGGGGAIAASSAPLVNSEHRTPKSGGTVGARDAAIASTLSGGNGDSSSGGGYGGGDIAPTSATAAPADAPRVVRGKPAYDPTVLPIMLGSPGLTLLTLVRFCRPTLDMWLMDGALLMLTWSTLALVLTVHWRGHRVIGGGLTGRERAFDDLLWRTEQRQPLWELLSQKPPRPSTWRRWAVRLLFVALTALSCAIFLFDAVLEARNATDPSCSSGADSAFVLGRQFVEMSLFYSTFFWGFRQATRPFAKPWHAGQGGVTSTDAGASRV